MCYSNSFTFAESEISWASPKIVREADSPAISVAAVAAVSAKDIASVK